MVKLFWPNRRFVSLSTLVSGLIVNFQARDHRKELELEFLGSEVESEDEADSDGEAHPVK